MLKVFSFACLLSALPGPPGVRYEDAYLSLYPIDRTKCPAVDRKRDILFELFTKQNPTLAQRLEVGNDDLLTKSNMNFSNPTIIYFHAFFESSIATSAVTIRSAYMQREEPFNVILLNAQRLIAGPWYFTASRNTRVVGEYSATLIDYLVSRGLHLDKLHLIGLSLGAQMAGVTGNNVKSGKVARITGLDPAKPLFTDAPLNLRLDPSDAKFVDIIHTDAGVFGFPFPTGHADFWPNSGRAKQPGCSLIEIKQRNPDSLLEPFFCSHWRAYQFYAESVVRPNSFASISCKNWSLFAKGQCQNNEWTNMGFAASSIARGNFYLNTNPIQPFSRD